MIIDFFVADTFASISGVQALLNHADKMPEVELQAQEDLKRLAESEDWEYPDYDIERQGLQIDSRLWVPKFSSYSAVILLCSIAETRLVASAERVGREKQSAFLLGDLKGHPLEAASRYLKRVIDVDVKADTAWEYLHDMQVLRNIIVHRGGQRGSTANQHKEFDNLVSRRAGMLASTDNHTFHEEIWVSRQFCTNSIEELTGFFKRLFPRLGFRHGRLGNDVAPNASSS